MTIPVVEVPQLKCPYCKTTEVRRYGQSKEGTVKYYRCTKCVYPDGSMDYTRFKVLVVE